MCEPKEPSERKTRVDQPHREVGCGRKFAVEPLDDMLRLLDLQDQVRDLYAEIGRIRKRLKIVGTGRQEMRDTIQQLRAEAQAARDRALMDRADWREAIREDFED